MTMNKAVFTALLAVAVIAAGFAGGFASRQQATPTSVGVVRLNELLAGLQETKAIETELQGDVERRQAEVDAIKQQIDEERANLEAAPNDAQKRIEIQARIFELSQLANARVNTQEQILNLRKGDAFRRLYQRISAAAEELATQQGFDLVVIDDSEFDLPERESGDQVMLRILNRRVLYSAEQIDITKQLEQLMNQKYAAGNR